MKLNVLLFRDPLELRKFAEGLKREDVVSIQREETISQLPKGS
jgi:hypothetical protein